MEMGHTLQGLDLRVGWVHVKAEEANVPVEEIKNIHNILLPGKAEQDVVYERERGPKVGRERKQN